MTPHVFEPDLQGDCQHCPLPQNHPTHVTPSAVVPPPQRSPEGRRPFNLLTKDEGMALAATSRASEEFRRTFFLAMAEVATRQEYLTTNDAWDLLEARGYRRSGHAQAAGTVGPSGQAIGLWRRTEQKALNTSGNLHSSDDGVRVYQSLIVGKDFETEVAPVVVEKARALAAKTAEREEAKAREAYDAVIPEGSETTEEWRVIGGVVNGAVIEVIEATDEHNARTLLARHGGKLQRSVVLRTPWTDVE